jgi:hypothetical protein
MRFKCCAVLAVIAGLLIVTPAALASWRPPQRLTWYWQLTGPIDTNLPYDAFDIDGFETSASTVSALHAEGKRVICYVDVGTWEDWRPDADAFPPATRGEALPGYVDERWLDIRAATIRTPLRERFEMCKRKGFDAVEPDNMDGYANATGFPITAADQLAFNRWVARTVHDLHLAVFQKNDVEQIPQLHRSFDGIIVEECAKFDECETLDPYLRTGKPVLQAEYGMLDPKTCADANAAGRMAVFTDVDLDGKQWDPCWTTDSCRPHPPPTSPH